MHFHQLKQPRGLARAVTEVTGSWIGAGIVSMLLLSGCVASRPSPAPAPLAGPTYDFTPAPPCSPAGSSKLTVAVASPRWQAPGHPPAIGTNGAVTLYEPKILWAVGPAMRADFFELLSCRGYLAKGPFDSFESMVYPDREASQLLLEPELQLDVDIPALAVVEKTMLGGLIKSRSGMAQLAGSATIGGRVTLSLKEPVTNTRMWARSIEVPAETVTFTTVSEYPTGASLMQVKLAVLDDDGLRGALQPRLELMYQRILSTAENYLDKRELTAVASQAVEVRKKASIGVPR